jgi:histidine triad (HIT) family protein
MPSIFTRIIQGEIPAFKVAEDEKHLAFLDINPLKKGHTLVIPKREEDYIFNLGDEELVELHLFAKKVALKMERVLPCERIGMTVIGLEVPHAHIHLIPIYSISDMDFSKPKLNLDPENMAAIAEAISQA